MLRGGVEKSLWAVSRTFCITKTSSPGVKTLPKCYPSWKKEISPITALLYHSRRKKKQTIYKGQALRTQNRNTIAIEWCRETGSEQTLPVKKYLWSSQPQVTYPLKHWDVIRLQNAFHPNTLPPHQQSSSTTAVGYNLKERQDNDSEEEYIRTPEVMRGDKHEQTVRIWSPWPRHLAAQTLNTAPLKEIHINAHTK